MLRLNALPRLLVTALATIAVVACANYKDPATEAVANIEEKLTGIGTQAEKYVPEELAKVQEQVAELKAGIEQKQYKAVVATAPTVLKAVNNLIVSSAIAKDAFTRQVQNDWTTYANEMPGVIASVDQQILRYTSRGNLPKGVSRDAFKETVATFDAAKAAWAEAATAGNEGRFEEAVTKTHEVKQVVDTVTQTLGMSGG